jgi:hypothetical protein
MCLLIWFWRRPEALAHPYVWDEESFVLRRFIEDGWASALHPVQGYLVLPTSLLLTISASVSMAHLPILTYSAATGIFGATIVLLVVPESRWGDRMTRSAMAVTLALVPINPEVFGVLLYSFWWCSLWPVIVLGWRHDLWGLRIAALIIAGLSSPAGGVLFVVFLLAWLLERRRRDIVGAAILFSTLAVQAVILSNSDRGSSLADKTGLRAVLEQVLRTVGTFTVRWLSPTTPDRRLLSFVGLLGLAALTWIALRPRVNHDVLLLGLSLIAFALLSAVPAPLGTDPQSGGPRYYFLPFAVMLWILVVVARRTDRRRALIAMALLCAGLFGLATTFSRSPSETVAQLNWKAELQKCAASSESVVGVPIYFDGSETYWRLELTPVQCQRYVRTPQSQVQHVTMG